MLKLSDPPINISEVFEVSWLSRSPQMRKVAGSIPAGNNTNIPKMNCFREKIKQVLNTLVDLQNTLSSY